MFLAKANGSVEARARYRDWDGKRREVQATAKTERAAERILKAKLADRTLAQPTSGELTPDSLLAELGEYWLEDLRAEGRVMRRTFENYEWVLRKVVLPVFGDLAPREIGVARCDRFVKGLARKSYSRARQARNVLRSALGLAVGHEVIPRNPVDGIARLHKPAHVPDAMTPAEVGAVRFAVGYWELGLSRSGPRPDGQLSVIIEVMLGTSARIGEALALRVCDVDLDSAPPSIRIAGTIASVKSKTAYRQDHPKTPRPS
jgi:integrase